MDIFDIAGKLCSVAAPSGFEKPVVREARALLEPLVDEVREDALGNLIGVKRCGKPDAKRLLLDAHLDEVGLIVTGFEEGFLRFSALGGIDPRNLPAAVVTVLSEKPVTGVVTCRPPHVLTDEEMNKAFPIKDLFIDLGMSEEAAKRAVRPGDAAVIKSGCTHLGDLLCCKALDDRLGFAVLLAAAERLRDTELDYDLYIMGSVQEELGLRGAEAGVFSIAPDLAVAVDVTFAASPDVPKHKTMEMGGGAAIGVGPNMNRAVTQRLIELAESRNIKYQLEVMAGSSGTNAWRMQISREGVATAVISIPIKYMHSPNEVSGRHDAEAAADLLCALAVSLKGDELGW